VKGLVKSQAGEGKLILRGDVHGRDQADHGTKYRLPPNSHRVPHR
jgi:hypothetical protein